MTPWQSFPQEIDGAIGSIRHDLSANRIERFQTVAAAVLPPVAGVSCYLAVTSGFDAPFACDDAPNGLPATTVDQVASGCPGIAAPATRPRFICGSMP